MTLTEIKKAVADGKPVHWQNPNYRVINDPKAGWLIRCDSNGYCIGLTRADGITLNGKEHQFYLAGCASGKHAPSVDYFEDKILELIDNANEFTRSDLQGAVAAIVHEILTTKAVLA